MAPLYLYPDDRRDLFAALEPHRQHPNIRPEVLATLAAAYGQAPTPEEVFHYIYAVLYAPS